MNLVGRHQVLWDYLRGSLWVLPSLSIVVFLAAGAVLSRVAISEDSPLWGLVFQGTAGDARQLLIVVSATMITVTGLVFGLTVVALQIASAQYSPRLLRNFMRDRGTQLVLSIFVGAFAYSTAGLHTVGVQRSGQQAFVPRLAVSGSLALGVASIGVLVYFIHHLAHSIQIDTIISDIERETHHVIDDLYPDQVQARGVEERCPDPPSGAIVVRSDRSGYIQTVEPAALVEVATRHDLVVRLARRAGDHVVAGTPIAWAWQPSGDRPSAPPELRAALHDAVHIGFERTMLQDVLFGLRRLVDIANKALSPAINDPYTAIQAMQQLSVLLCTLAGRRLGDRLCHDEQETLRVAVPLPDFAEYLLRGTAQIRRAGAREPAVARSLIQLLRDVGDSTFRQDRRATCARHIWLVLDDAKRETSQPADLELVLADGTAALSALEADHPQATGG
ncbi:MAG TPA: DUF2254 domain-containing protein [Actinomycetes bacterium]|jgi:uncharacterized membrane protein|nr:DUF2254 domain-containing protein [Actinomycetes bacterium]